MLPGLEYSHKRSQKLTPDAMSHSTLLRSKIQLTCTDMQQAFDEVWRHPELPNLFPSFLILLHQIMRASVPLMEAAHRESLRMAPDDPVAAALADYFEKHIDEERDHDAWTLDDLESIGFTREEVLGRTPLPDVASFIGAQYYWLHHHHPVTQMGYIAVLEGSPPSVAHIERLKKVTGLPDDAFRTYAFHGDVDPHHTEDLDRALDAMPLTRWHAGLIGMSAAHTGRGLADSLRALRPIDRPVAALGG